MFRLILRLFRWGPNFCVGDVLVNLLRPSSKKFIIEVILYTEQEYLLRDAEHNICYYISWKTAEKEYAKCGIWNNKLAKGLKRW